MTRPGLVLRGTDFGRVLCSSGARGFFGDGYWWHGYLRPFGLDWSGSTFVAKTTTLLPRDGNMEMRLNGTDPRRLFPDCVRVKWWRGTVLNAVGLSGPGAVQLLGRGRWQRRREPFFISFMSVEGSASARLDELRKFVDLLGPKLPEFRAPVGLEINMSCPNVGVDHGRPVDAIREAQDTADIAARLGIPVVPNYSPDSPVAVPWTVARESSFDALSVANTVGWGRIPDRIDWGRTWGDRSPLAKYGGGGISGAPLRPVVLSWVRHAAELGMTKPLIAGGGILSVEDAMELMRAGADAVKLGTVAMLRPWRVGRMVERVRMWHG